jgi:hypothetical protein
MPFEREESVGLIEIRMGQDKSQTESKILPEFIQWSGQF